jgi:hypothetical protein
MSCFVVLYACRHLLEDYLGLVLHDGVHDDVDRAEHGDENGEEYRGNYSEEFKLNLPEQRLSPP